MNQKFKQTKIRETPEEREIKEKEEVN